ncbi:MAG: sigma-70 family RNA polymerase sigma factor [Pedobacter sp.]|nr:MAG: sigma-70 family RNA polymerase sigma factor [Pedobacter sp.]
MKTHLNIENEKTLFALLKQGDEIAFSKIYKAYWAELYNTAYKRLPEKEKCQDIIQNVFADLWTRRELVEIENPTAYLHTAVRFQVLKQVSRNPQNSFLSENFIAELISPLETDGELLEKEVTNLINLYIDALPKKRKHIFVMHYFDGLTTAKIATELNISQKTVQNQLTTASHALRFRLTHMFFYIIVFLSLFSK